MSKEKKSEVKKEPRQVFAPTLNERGALVGWRKVDEGSEELTFVVLPEVPTKGTHRWNGEKWELIPPPKRWLPQFDSEGGLIGFRETTLDKVPLGALSFDHLPDNACDGRYRWDDNLRRFEPRPHIVVKLGDTATINKMTVSGLLNLVDRETLPLAVQDQIRFIETTSPETVIQLKQRYADLTRALKV